MVYGWSWHSLFSSRSYDGAAIRKNLYNQATHEIYMPCELITTLKFIKVRKLAFKDKFSSYIVSIENSNSNVLP